MRMPMRHRLVRREAAKPFFSFFFPYESHQRPLFLSDNIQSLAFSTRTTISFFLWGFLKLAVHVKGWLMGVYIQVSGKDNVSASKLFRCTTGGKGPKKALFVEKIHHDIYFDRC